MVMVFFIEYYESPICFPLKLLFIGDSLMGKHRFYCFQKFPFANNVFVFVVPPFVHLFFLSTFI